VKLLRRADPLVLFLIAGLALYLVLDALGLAGGSDRQITVDEAALSSVLASEGGRLPGRTFDALSPVERRKLVDDYVRDEALYREARALGLDREDPGIRRRLIQSLRFSLEGRDDGAVAKPSDAELRAFLKAHRERYADSAKVSFSHVFFDKAKRGEDGAREAALEALGKVGAGDWLAMGDRYPYQRSQVDVTEDALASEMGEAAARRIFALAQTDRWQGPIETTLGFHLIRIDRKSAGGEPDFADIREELAEGLARERREQAERHVIDGIVRGYRVRISPEIEKQLK